MISMMALVRTAHRLNERFEMNIALLDPHTRKLLDQASRTGAPAWNAVPLHQARQSFEDGARANAGPAPALHRVEDLIIPNAIHALPARLYVPDDANDAPRATLLFFHGGGFVLGSLDSHDAFCRHLSAQSGVQVLSVNYRLAPEHKFPAALDDALSAASWITNRPEKINADPARLAIGGDSAGANLATTACRLLSLPGATPFRHQLLFYPMTDLSLSHPSIAMFGEGYRLTADLLRWFVDLYLGVNDAPTDPRASPLHAQDLSLLPPTWLLTAGFDPLCDEGRAYGLALEKAGVPCTHVRFEDMIHGFCNMPGVIPRATDALTEAAKALRNSLS